MTSIWLRILPYIAALLIGATGAWMWQANSYEQIIATNEAARQADMARISAAGAAQASQAAEKQQAAERALADLDQKNQKEKTDGLAENEKLRRVAADSARRLRVAGSCRAGGGNVSGSAIGPSLGDAGTVELSAASGSTVFDIRAGIIADQAALRALQAYVMNVCRPSAGR
ncbi:lysis system i-spanin subunit Rz [Pseudomonas sp. FP1740]|uniref:lysis system i-spanin subunit Rz n=1 Tax=Pseudomonas sp. FP1740 TaxID=2954078 RepID=UPI002734B139|nr:lysis system i-spanin subunit Rz [Pseudomonas sp. FP1740]WLG43216.1 lysis system i-spanin subunit Rz [Pseudomonas sp. FP1740]